jgi:hypothetical protein
MIGMYAPSVTLRRSSTFLSLSTAAVPLLLSIAVAPACGPRKGPVGPTQSATIASATPTAPPPATTAPASSATTWAIPGLAIPGLPMSPRQALVGRWKVAGVDGKPVATSPGMATDPMDPASYVAGSEVSFTADQVTLSRGGVAFMNRPYKVVQEFPPVRVTIDAGYGASNVDFAIDGSAIWSLPSTPPHALSLTRAQ